MRILIPALICLFFAMPCRAVAAAYVWILTLMAV
jgi:hypothetical protein